MTLPIDDLAEEIADIFEHTGWKWGLALAGIPERVPDAEEIAAKLDELHDRPRRTARLASHGRIALVRDPEYPDSIRVLLDVGEIPL